jgi:Domain of unknown function (DUF4326)
MPKRIQRKRTRGWEMPLNAVYVGRPSKWGNPFKVGGYVRAENGLPLVIPDAVYAVKLFAANALHPQAGYVFRENVKRELRGKDLACWCPLVDKDGNPVPCHADILLEIANAPQAAS